MQASPHLQAQPMSPHMRAMQQQQQQQMVGVPIFVPMMVYPGQHPGQQSPYVPPARPVPGEQYPQFPQLPRRSSGHCLSPTIDSSVVDRLKEDRLSLCDSMSTTSGWIDGESSLGDSGGSSVHRRL